MGREWIEASKLAMIPESAEDDTLRGARRTGSENDRGIRVGSDRFGGRQAGASGKGGSLAPGVEGKRGGTRSGRARPLRRVEQDRRFRPAEAREQPVEISREAAARDDGPYLRGLKNAADFVLRQERVDRHRHETRGDDGHIRATPLGAVLGPDSHAVTAGKPSRIQEGRQGRSLPAEPLVAPCFEFLGASRPVAEGDAIGEASADVPQHVIEIGPIEGWDVCREVMLDHFVSATKSTIEFRLIRRIARCSDR